MCFALEFIKLGRCAQLFATNGIRGGVCSVVWLLCLGLLGGGAYAQTFPLTEIAPGLTGYAVTAAAGNVLESFPIEVLALHRDAGLGFPLVLVKASGEFIETTGGVAAGMSGSPVYLPRNGSDALLGAISYVFPSSDHSLALVTPIEAMRGHAEALEVAPFNEQLVAALGDPRAVSTPILMSGLSERAISQLESLFAGTAMTPMPVQLGGGAPLDESGYVLEPGSAVSVQLARGDVTIAGIGTVTAVEGDQVLAFGHPFLGQGEVSFAMAPAFVSYIVPSDVVPFKLADSGQTLLGTVTQDRPAAITGRLGVVPTFMPVTLTMNGDAGTLTKTFDLANDERYYAPLLASAVLQLFDEAVQQQGAGTTELAWEIELADGDTVRVLEQVTDPQDITFQTALLAGAPLAILANNIFETPAIARVSLNISYSASENYAEVVEVIAEDEELAAGDIVVLYIRLQPYRGEPEVRTLSFRLPEDAKGSVDISVRGGLEAAPEPEKDDGEPILSYGELLVALRDNVQGSELVVDTRIDGDRVRLKRLSFPYLIQGEQEVTIDIESDEEDVSEGDVEPQDDSPDLPDPSELEPDDPSDPEELPDIRE